MKRTSFRSGDWVVFCKTKVSTVPGQRARDVQPSRSGESYDYLVDKYWVVQEINADGKLVLRTKQGKRHEMGVDDLRLRKANVFERWFYAARFRAVENIIAKV